MTGIVIDTETTGLTRLSYVDRLNYKQWPRLVQIAWVRFGEDGIEERQETIIRPDDFRIPENASQIHGISHEEALLTGVEVASQLNELNVCLQKVQAIVAHNLNFDLGILESEAMRAGFRLNLPSKRFCTVFLGREYLRKAKGRKRGGFPKLDALYEELFGFTYSHKHTAGADTTACYHIFNRLRKLGYVG